MRRLDSIRLVLVALIGAACSSAPVRYYTLVPPMAASSGLAAAECCNVRLRRVTVPPGIDRPELVTRSSDDEAVVLSNSVWLAPLRDEIRAALADEIHFKLSAGVPESIVDISVTRFEALPGQYIVVAARWSITRVGSPKAAPLSCETTERIAVDSGVPALVQGFQRALAMIADEILRDLRVADD